MASDLPSLQISSLVSESIPDHLRDCLAFSVGRESVLLYDKHNAGESLYYELSTQEVVRSRSVRFGATPSQDTELVGERYLTAIGMGRIVSYDLADGRTVSWPRPQAGMRTLESTTIQTPGAGLFLVGGKDRGNHYIRRDVEYCDYSDRRGWQTMPSLQHARHDAAGVYVRSEGANRHRICVIGGHYWHRPTTRYAECPYTEVFDGVRWILGPSLNCPRRGHRAVLVGETVIVLGGTNAGELVDSIEAWNQEMEYFVVIGHLPVPRRNFSAISRGSDVFIFGGGTTSIEKVSFDINELTPEALLPLVSDDPPSRVDPPPVSRPDPVQPPMPAPQEHTAAPVPTPQEHAVVPDNNPGQANLVSTTVGDDNTLRISGLPLIPEPPTRPRFPISPTLQDRAHALNEYIDKLEKLKEQHTHYLEKTVQRITDAYQRACNEDIEMVQVHGKVWMEDTERLIQQARAEAAFQEVFIKKQENQLSATVKEVDRDDFEDGIPSQLRCPITLNLMSDPVVAADGNTYERSALDQWFASSQSSKPMSPLTGAELPTKDYFSVHILKSLCQQFAETKDA